eukprot:scaffold14982_cov62-Phaeocystis_antarctica.AAC.3
MAPPRPGGQVRHQTSGWSNHGEHQNGEPEPDTVASAAEARAAATFARPHHPELSPNFSPAQRL